MNSHRKDFVIKTPLHYGTQEKKSTGKCIPEEPCFAAKIFLMIFQYHNLLHQFDCVNVKL